MRQLYAILLVAILSISVSVSISGCGKRAKKDARQLTALVSIEGSDTMADLVRSWADTFMKKEPDVPISVNSANSGSGIEALINRTTDLAAASRDLNDSESSQLRAKSIRLKRVTVARDSIAIVINADNPVQFLTLAQLKDVFSGAVKDWKQVGGKSQPIVVFSREDKSGTFNFFKEHLLQNLPHAKSAQTVLSGEDVIAAVAKDKGGIGYIGMGAAAQAHPSIKVLALKLEADSEPVKPTELSTINDYPLSRPLILFMDEEPKPTVKKFVDYCISADAQKLVSKAGFAPIDASLK